MTAHLPYIPTYVRTYQGSTDCRCNWDYGETIVYVLSYSPSFSNLRCFVFRCLPCKGEGEQPSDSEYCARRGCVW